VDFSNNVCVWHRFRDITKRTVYVTGCDHVRFPIHMYTYRI